MLGECEMVTIGPVSIAPSTFVDYRLESDHKRRAHKQRASDPDTKRYVSPWEPRRVRSGQTLNIEVLLAQKALREGRTPPSSQTVLWINKLSESINNATGERRQQLIQQQNNLMRCRE